MKRRLGISVWPDGHLNVCAHIVDEIAGRIGIVAVYDIPSWPAFFRTPLATDRTVSSWHVQALSNITVTHKGRIRR
jgi:hypothetical protein